MKKIIFSLILALVTVGANAQGFGGGRQQRNPEDMAKRQVERIKEACSLTDDQYNQIYNFYLAQSKQQQAEMDSIMKANGNDQSGRPRFNREDMEKRRQATNEKIKSILTEEQYAKYEELQKQQRERRGQGGPRGGDGQERPQRND